MLLTWVHVLIGLVVGILVGLTGVGGGVILLPILIFGLKVPPLVAVGSDAAFNALTKIGAGFFHWRAGNVSKRLAVYLGCGSLPGALIGVLVLNELRRTGEAKSIRFLFVLSARFWCVFPFCCCPREESSVFSTCKGGPHGRSFRNLLESACCPVFWWE